MAAETEELEARVLNELTNLKMGRYETLDAFMNRVETLRNVNSSKRTLKKSN